MRPFFLVSVTRRRLTLLSFLASRYGKESGTAPGCLPVPAVQTVQFPVKLSLCQPVALSSFSYSAVSRGSLSTEPLLVMSGSFHRAFGMKSDDAGAAFYRAYEHNLPRSFLSNEGRLFCHSPSHRTLSFAFDQSTPISAAPADIS